MCSVAERQTLRDTVNVGRPENLRFSQRPPPFGAFPLEQMTPPGAPEQDFPGTGYLETFAYGLFGLNAFGASHMGSLNWRARGILKRSRGVKGGISRDFKPLSRQLAQ